MKSFELNAVVRKKTKFIPCPKCHGKKHHLILHDNTTIAMINCLTCKGTGKLLPDKQPKHLSAGEDI